MKCIYHVADLDGHCSGAIVKYQNSRCEMIPYDYGKVFPWEKFKDSNETVYMVDVSLPAKDMRKLADMCNLIWIDHHKTAIDEVLEEGLNLPGLREIGQSACELTWKYLFPDRELPESVYLLGRYDVWDWQDKPRALPFQYGMKMEKTWPGQPVWNSLFSEKDINASKFLEDILRKGKIVLRYQKNEDKKYAKGYAFESEFEGYRILAVNRGMTGSQIFDSIWDKEKHDIMVVFCLKQKEDGGGYFWKVSLFTEKLDINVGKIAKSYGGGGHQGAAGFSCDKLPFLKERQ